jgi:predicted nuclease of restriction endonuclease-like (RecB) superfamily
MAGAERWSVRTLRERIDSMLYERTALSKESGKTIARELAAMRDAQRMSPALVMRDPYILDFLGLQDTWQEGDLEAAIIREMESFLLELGSGFTFVARQKRIQIDDEDFHLDLLFYNRQVTATGCDGVKGWRVQGRLQGTDGTVPALARQARARADSEGEVADRATKSREQVVLTPDNGVPSGRLDNIACKLWAAVPGWGPMGADGIEPPTFAV